MLNWIFDLDLQAGAILKLIQFIHFCLMNDVGSQSS